MIFLYGRYVACGRMIFLYGRYVACGRMIFLSGSIFWWSYVS